MLLLMLIKMVLFCAAAAVSFTLLPSVLPFDFTVQTLAAKIHVSAQKSQLQTGQQ